MAFTYLPSTTDIGRVRMLVPDSDPANAIFQDEEIASLLTMEGNRTKKAAALALEVIASSEAYTQKVVRLLDLSTDGSKVSDALLKRAALLRKQDADDLAAEEEIADASGFEVAEWFLGDASIRDAYDRRYYRGA